MKLNILAFGVHPDDVELSCSGTLLHHINKGYTVGIIDLTQGELGTRGSAEIRMKEAANAAKVLGLSIRENLKMADGFFENNKANQLQIIKMIRKYQPDIVFANAIKDRHPDHGRAAKLVSDACFYAGLRKIETIDNNTEQTAWRPKSIYHYIQFRNIKPDFAVDISKYINGKIESVKAYSSQFYDANSTEPETLISSQAFFKSITERAADMGRIIGVEYAEGFTCERYLGVDDVVQLL